jgi:hypothetical protein
MKIECKMGTGQVPQMTHKKYMGRKDGPFDMICPISRYAMSPYQN